MRPDARRHELDMAAQSIRELLHYARLDALMDLSTGAELMRTLGARLDNFASALSRECGADVFEKRYEPFWDVAHIVATRFEEREREIEAELDRDPRADRGCWQYHQMGT